MRGRAVFMQSLLSNRADVIFGNPGTTENPLLESLIEFPDIQYFTALHEGVAVCAAGLYAQVSGKTALANLHVAPGLGNAIGMMYGCLRAKVPVIITAGQQDTRLRLRQPLLSHDLVAMAQPVVKLAAEPSQADEIAPLMAEAFQVANTYPRGPVFISLPNNVMEQETEAISVPNTSIWTASTPSPQACAQVAAAIGAAQRIAILAGDDVAVYGADESLRRLVTAIGADVYTDFLSARMAFPSSHANYGGRLPASTAPLRKLLEPYDLVLLTGGVTVEEVWFDAGHFFNSGTRVIQIELAQAALQSKFAAHASVCGDLTQTYNTILDTIAKDGQFVARVATEQARKERAHEERSKLSAARFEQARGQVPMTPSEALCTLAVCVPEDAVLVDESITASGDLDRAFAKTSSAEFFAGRGGGIGQGVAGALGVAVALADKLTVAVSGDGSAMYSIQALWSAAHHNLNLLFVILANEEYRVLKHNLDIHRARFDAPSDQPYPHMDLAGPTLDFSNMANGMGLPSAVARTPAEIEAACQQLLAEPGPALLEIKVAGKP
ncbi:MAG: thiamine pyrophosphate-binding protein [Pseudomonadota bacterium]